MLRRLGLGTTGASVIGGAFAYYEAKRKMGDDALSRLISYDKVALPAILEYKWEEAKCEKLPKLLPALFPPVSDEEERQRFEVLHRKYARPLFDKFMELGGFYYKSGQKIASNQGGVVPKLYVDMFQPFLNAIPPRNFAEVRTVLEGELGRPMEEVFSSFDGARRWIAPQHPAMAMLARSRPMLDLTRCCRGADWVRVDWPGASRDAALDRRASRRQGAEPRGGAHLPWRRLRPPDPRRRLHASDVTRL